MNLEASSDYYYYYNEEPTTQLLAVGSADTCAKCLAAGKDYCIAENRCTARGTRSCNGAKDHVTGSPEFARSSPGHSMKCPRSDAGSERGFLEHHGRKGFPVLLEVRGETTDKLIHDLRAHATELSATGCETATEPCKVTFELYECPVRAHHHVKHRHHHFHRISPICGFLWSVMNVCCCFALLRVIRICLCGRRRGWGSQNTDGNAALLPSAQGAPVQGRIVNGVIIPHNAPSAGPAPSPTTVTPTPTAPAQAVQPAAVFPVAPAAPAAPLPAHGGFCPSCGTPHPEGHRFCGACGHSLLPGVSAGPAYPQLPPVAGPSAGPAYPQLAEPGAGLNVQG